jgi:hypothetical protein
VSEQNKDAVDAASSSLNLILRNTGYHPQAEYNTTDLMVTHSIHSTAGHQELRHNMIPKFLQLIHDRYSTSSFPDVFLICS